MATFITSKLTGETITITIQTSTGWWKYNHNGTNSSIYDNRQQTIEVLNANGEFTIISCDIDGTPDGVITKLDLRGNSLTSFDGTGLSSLTELKLGSSNVIGKNGQIISTLANSLTSFDGTGLSSVTLLDLKDNPLVTFIGGDLQLLSTIDLRNIGFGGINSGWNITTLESIDITGMDNLQYLFIENNPLINNPSVNNSLLQKLAANQLANEWEEGEFYTTVGRTSTGTTDYDYLIAKGWTVEGVDLSSATIFNGSFIAGRLNNYYTDNITITEQDILDAINEIGVDYTLPGWSNSLIAPDNTVIWTGDFSYSQDGEIFITWFGDDESLVSGIYPILNAVVTDPDGTTYVLASGDFSAGSYAGYFTGSDVNLGELLTGNLPSNTDGFSGIATNVNPNETFTNIPGITNIISLTINGESVDISTQSSDGGGISLSGIDLAFEDGETYTFSLVADVPVVYRKLRVRGVGQINPNI